MQSLVLFPIVETSKLEFEDQISFSSNGTSEIWMLFSYPILDIISEFRWIKYGSHCFTFSTQTHLKQVPSTSNLGYDDHYLSGSSDNNISLLRKFSMSASDNKLSVNFWKKFFNVESTKHEQTFSRTKRVMKHLLKSSRKSIDGLVTCINCHLTRIVCINCIFSYFNTMLFHTICCKILPK